MKKFLPWLFLLAACGHKQTVSWPAYVTSISGFSEEKNAQVVAAIQDLNRHSNREVLKFSKIENGYPIKFVYNKNKVDAEDGNILVGMAHTSEEDCEVEIYETAFEGTLVEAVVWHEIGHCGGLDHIEDKDAIMYHLAYSFTSYEKKDLDKFVETLLKSVHMK